MSHIGLYDALVEAGTSKDTARTAVLDIPSVQNLATKTELLEALTELKVDIANLRADLGKARGDLYWALWIQGVGIVVIVGFLIGFLD